MKQSWYLDYHNNVHGGSSVWSDRTGNLMADDLTTLDLLTVDSASSKYQFDSRLIPWSVKNSTRPPLIFIGDPVIDFDPQLSANYQESIERLQENEEYKEVGLLVSAVLTGGLYLLDNSNLPLLLASVASLGLRNKEMISALSNYIPQIHLPELLQFLPEMGYGNGSFTMFRTAVTVQKAIDYAKSKQFDHIGHLWGISHMHMHSAISGIPAYRHHIIKTGAEKLFRTIYKVYNHDHDAASNYVAASILPISEWSCLNYSTGLYIVDQQYNQTIEDLLNSVHHKLKK